MLEDDVVPSSRSGAGHRSQRPSAILRPAEILGRDVSRDVICALRDKDMVTAGPRSPAPGAFTYVTTKAFVKHFGIDTNLDLPDLEGLEDAVLLSGNSGGVTFASPVAMAEPDPHDQNGWDKQDDEGLTP